MVPQEFRVGAGIAGFVLVLGVCFFAGFYYLITTVRFEDRRLEAAIREVIAKPDGRISTAEAAKWSKFLLPNVGFESLGGLEHFVYLQELDFTGNQIRDISPLANLKSLRLLTLDGNQIRNLSPLRELYGLQMLSIDNNRITDIEPISALPNLWILSLQFNPDLWNLAPGNVAVSMLGVRGCKLQNLQALGGFPNLAYLEAGENEITSLYGIEQCTALEVLSLDSNRIARIDDASGSPTITLLDLKNNGIKYINAIPDFPALTRLELAHNEIVQLPDISHLSNLQVLALDGNPLSAAICAGADFYRGRGLAVSTDTCPDLPPAPRENQQAHGGIPAWKRRQIEAIEMDKNRSMTPGFKSRISTPGELQQIYDPSGINSPPSREF